MYIFTYAYIHIHIYIYIYVLCYIPVLSKYQIKSYVVYGIIYIYIHIYVCFMLYMLHVVYSDCSKVVECNGTCKQS